MTQERKAMLILAVALALIVSLAIRFGGREAPATLTQERLNTLKSAVIAFTASHGQPPRALTDLQVDTETLRDHIGEPFLYEVDGATISITSHGADRAPGGFFFKRDYKLTFDLTDSVTGDE